MNTCRTVNFFILSLLPLTAISETLIDSGKSGDWEWEIYAEKTVAGTNLTDGEPGSLDLRCEKAKGCSYVITFDNRDFDAQCQHGSEMNSLMDGKGVSRASVNTVIDRRDFKREPKHTMLRHRKIVIAQSAPCYRSFSPICCSVILVNGGCCCYQFVII